MFHVEHRAVERRKRRLVGFLAGKAWNNSSQRRHNVPRGTFAAGSPALARKKSSPVTARKTGPHRSPLLDFWRPPGTITYRLREVGSAGL